MSVPPRFIVPVVNLPVKPTSKKPDILLVSPATTALLLVTLPLVTDLILLISSADAVISFVPRVKEAVVKVPVRDTSLNPLISLLESVTTALEPLTVPSLTSCKVFNSEALAVTRVPPNLRPDEVVLWDAISNISGPLVAPILVNPVVPCVITLPLLDSPIVILSRTPSESSLSVVKPNTRLPPTLRLLVICCEPLTVTSPPLTTTLPVESIVILSDASAEPPVINESVVGLDVELKSPSDFATIEAPTIVDTSPVASSGDWNSILPRTSLICISLDDDCNFNIEPSLLLEVILLTVVVPEISRLAASTVLVIVTSLNPEMSPLSPAITTFPFETVPPITPSNLLICSALELTSVPPRLKVAVVNLPVKPTSLNPDMFLLTSTTTTCSWATLPLVIPCNILISSAVDNISVPPSLIVPVVNLPVKPTLANPVTLFWLSTITTFPSDTVPILTPVNLSISPEIPVIFTPATLSVWEVNFPANVISFIAVTSLFISNITALEALAVPAETSSI